MVIFYRAGKLMYKNNSDQIRLCPASWQLQGEAYILKLLAQSRIFKINSIFGLTPSFLGRFVQVMWEVIALTLLVLMVSC